jgi:hypothetical protein
VPQDQIPEEWGERRRDSRHDDYVEAALPKEDAHGHNSHDRGCSDPERDCPPRRHNDSPYVTLPLVRASVS